MGGSQKNFLLKFIYKGTPSNNVAFHKKWTAMLAAYPKIITGVIKGKKAFKEALPLWLHVVFLVTAGKLYLFAINKNRDIFSFALQNDGGIDKHFRLALVWHQRFGEPTF